MAYAILRYVFGVPPHLSRTLLVGLGGGCMASMIHSRFRKRKDSAPLWHPGGPGGSAVTTNNDECDVARVDAIELEAEVVAMARAHFGLPDDVNVAIAEAAGALVSMAAGTPPPPLQAAQYDVVILDVYAGVHGSAVPSMALDFFGKTVASSSPATMPPTVAGPPGGPHLDPAAVLSAATSRAVAAPHAVFALNYYFPHDSSDDVDADAAVAAAAAAAAAACDASAAVREALPWRWVLPVDASQAVVVGVTAAAMQSHVAALVAASERGTPHTECPQIAPRATSAVAPAERLQRAAADAAAAAAALRAAANAAAAAVAEVAATAAAAAADVNDDEGAAAAWRAAATAADGAAAAAATAVLSAAAVERGVADACETVAAARAALPPAKGETEDHARAHPAAPGSPSATAEAPAFLRFPRKVLRDMCRALQREYLMAFDVSRYV